MTIQEIINQYQVRHVNNYLWEIQEVKRIDIADWLRQMDAKIGVEVGVAFGKFLKVLCEKNPQMKLYGVDQWQPYEGYTDYTLNRTYKRMVEETKARIKNCPQCELINSYSMEAVKNFADNSLDFVYIDANHHYEYVLEDITEWTKKVRPGGIVAGHDYVKPKNDNYGVKKAVNEYAKRAKIDPLYVLGKTSKHLPTRRDHFRSWMFIK